MNPKESLLAFLALLVAALPATGEIVAGFSNTFTQVPDQYPGIGGDGWEAGWGRTASGSQPVLAIQNATPIGAGGNYLKITSNATSDNAFGRRFLGGPVDTTLPHTLTFDVRIDSLTGWATGNDYLSIHGTRSTSTFNVSADSSFIFRAFGASPGNSNEAVPTALHAKEWLLYNSTATRAGYSAANFRNSGMPIDEGKTYSFTVNIDPVNKQYTVSITDGTNTVSNLGPFGWRDDTPSTGLAFNHKCSSTSNILGYSLDNVVIQSNVEGETNTVARFTDGSPFAVDQWTGIAGDGWDGGWANPGVLNALVDDFTPVNGSGNYLSVLANKTSDSSFGRDFDGITAVPVSGPVAFSFDIRMDELGADWDAAGDYLSIHSPSSNASSYNPSNLSTFIIRAFGASPAAGLNANEWLLYDGAADGSFDVANFKSSGMTLSEGATYHFTVVSNPATKKYDVTVSNGTQTVTVKRLGWRAATASDHLAFNHKVSVGGDSYAYSLDNILINSTTVADDYQDWATSYSLTGGSGADDDGDGLTNAVEYAFGLLPNSGSSVNPITVPLNRTLGTLSFQRRDVALTGMTFTVWTSTNLGTWTQDPGAVLTPGAPDGNQVQQVAVMLSPALLTESKLFVQVRAQ
jgi:hypothetical protein